MGKRGRESDDAYVQAAAQAGRQAGRQAARQAGGQGEGCAALSGHGFACGEGR